jgi:hypothetical protein
MDKANLALSRGLPIFITEYGTVEASGAGAVDHEWSKKWWDWADKNKISYANWAISNKPEGASALLPGTTSAQVGDDSRLTESGKLVKAHLRSQNNGVGSCSGASPSNPSNTNPSNGGTCGPSQVKAYSKVDKSWGIGASHNLVFENNCSEAICDVEFTLDTKGVSPVLYLIIFCLEINPQHLELRFYKRK